MEKNKCILVLIIVIGSLSMLAFSGNSGSLNTTKLFSSTNVDSTMPAGINRIDLQQHDLSVPGREVVQTRVDFDSGAVAPMHNHPGEEIVYVLEGLLEYRLVGELPVTLKTGDVLFIPAGMIHTVKNVGSGIAKELATYFVETGKPLIVIIK